MADFMEGIGSVLSGVGDVLDTPRRLLWDAFGGPTKGNELIAALTGIDPQSGLAQGLGFGAEMLGDPLNLVGLGVGRALGKFGGFAGKAATATAPQVNMAEELLTRAPTGLTHFTTNAGLEGIGRSGALRGAEGIFALPDATRAESGAIRSLFNAGISPAATHPLAIPAEALQHFERPLVAGPYSAWKRLGGVRYAPPGEIDMMTGALNATGSIWQPRLRMIAPDIAGYTEAAKWLSRFNAMQEPSLADILQQQ
jgi:hypothetical protein